MACISVLSAPQEIDEYELVDPVDILTPLEKSGFGMECLVLSLYLILFWQTVSLIYLFSFDTSDSLEF